MKKQFRTGEILISGSPLIDLVIYYNRAIKDQHWLEAIVLAHMYIESQLRTVLKKDVRKAKNGEKVIELARIAFQDKKIEQNLLDTIKEFNTKRNTAVHNLAIGLITYDQLEQTAVQAGSLIEQLRAIYAYQK